MEIDVKKAVKIIVAGLVAVSLSSCSWISDYFDSPDNTEPPAELVEFTPDVDIVERWYLDVDEGSKNLNLQVALSDTTAYVIDSKGLLSAIDPEKGNALWSRKTAVKVRSGPVYEAGVIYLGTRDAELVAVTADKVKDGNGVLWRTSLSSEVLALPTVTDDKVIVRMSDGRITAVSKVDGRHIWSFQRRQPLLTLRGVSRPLVNGNQVLVGLDDGHMVSLAEDTGQVIWDKAVAVPRGTTELQRIVDLDANPVIDQGSLFVASYSGKLAALSVDSGQPLWSRDLSIHSGIAISGSHVVVVDQNDAIWAIDRRTGASYWKQDMLRARRLGAPIIVGDYVLVADLEGYVHAFNIKDGHLSDRKQIDESGIVSMRVMSDERFIVLGHSGEVTMLGFLKDSR